MQCERCYEALVDNRRPGMTRNRWQTWVALAAIYAVAFQTIFIALSQGLQVAPTSHYGVICSGSGAPSPADPQSPQKVHDACCNLACTMFSPVLGLPSEGSIDVARAGIATRTPIAKPKVIIGGVGWNPGNPRAPPFAA